MKAGLRHQRVSGIARWAQPGWKFCRGILRVICSHTIATLEFREPGSSDGFSVARHSFCSSKSDSLQILSQTRFGWLKYGSSNQVSRFTRSLVDWQATCPALGVMSCDQVGVLDVWWRIEGGSEYTKRYLPALRSNSGLLNVMML